MIRREPEILYEDSQILVCWKEAGMAVQSAGIRQMDLESCLKIYLVGKQPGRVPYLGIIQRLDQPVEGVLVFAKTAEAAARLSRQLQQGKIKKEYLALVEGCVWEGAGRLEDYLEKDGRTNTSRVVSCGTAGAKKAVLEYEKAGEDEGKTLLKIRLFTGRHHQIRVQLAHLGHPLAGDKKYGARMAADSRAIGLCAVKTGFYHPKTGKWMEFQISPKGEIFREFCKNMPV